MADTQNQQGQQPSRESAPECWCAREIPVALSAGGGVQIVRHGSRFVGFEVAGPRVVEGREFCTCQKGEETFVEAQEKAREREAKQRQDRHNQIEQRKLDYLIDADIPRRFLDIGSDYEVTLDGSPLAQTHAGLIRRLKESDSDESWLLWGKHGTGKTGLAVAWALQHLRRDEPDHYPTKILFRTAPDLFTELRATYSPRRDDDPTEAELLTRYADVGVFVLDDIGAEQIKDSGWLEDRLYQIIGRRHAELMGIFLTSNLSPAELGARIGERIMWRIVEMCGEDNIVEIKGENQRKPRRRDE